MIQTVRDPLVVLDARLCIERANQAFYDAFQLTPRLTLAQPFYELAEHRWDRPEMRKLLEDILLAQKVVRDFPVAGMVLNARALEWAGQLKLLILFAFTGKH